MPLTQPFSDLLDALRAKGMPLGIREYVAFAELWTRMAGATVVELRGAAGALLGSSPEEVRLVTATFDEMYGQRPAAPPPPPPPIPPSALRRWRQALWRSMLARWIASVVLVGLGALALWSWTLGRPSLPSLPAAPPPPWSPPLPPPRSTNVPPPGGVIPGNPEVPPAPILPPPPLSFKRWTALATLGLTGVGTLLLVQWPRVRATERRRLERSRRRARASLSGPTTFELTPLDPPTWFDKRDLEDAATLLGRAFTTGFASARLDPTRTVRTTIARGGVPTFVYEASAASGTLLVLEDLAPEMAVWASKVAFLLAALRRQGVRIEHWVFDGTPALVGRDGFSERIPLEQVARRVPASGVLVVSSGAGLTGEMPSQGPDWRDALRQWTRRSWLNPVVASGAWREALRALPLNVWPLTGHGLLDAAADLAVDPEGRRQRLARHDGAGARVLADDVERMKRLIAVAGQPSVDLVEVLRQRFIPDAPEDTVLAVLAEAEHGSPRLIRLEREEVRRLLAAERRENPARERAVRAYVLGLLALQPAPEGSLAHLRWRLCDASQRAALAELGVGDAAAPRETLRELAAGPIFDEVDEAAHGLGDVVPPDAFGPPGGSGRGVTALAREGATAAGSAWPRGWLFPRPLELVVATLVALAVAAGLRSVGAFVGDPIPHVENAYRLAFSDVTAAADTAGTLTAALGAAASGNTPTSAQLYRDGQLFGDPFDLPALGEVATDTAVGTMQFPESSVIFERPIATADTGHHYQVRAVMRDGNLAVSGSVWVAPSPQTLAISVDALPWAEVRVFNPQTGQPSGTGTNTTPTVLNLPAGSYRFEFTNPEFATLSRDVTVEPGADPQVKVVMPGFDAATTARQLLQPPPATKK